MLLSRYGTFTGGIDLPDEKYATLHRPIAPPPGLTRLRVPLAPCGKSAAAPLVALGQDVTAGQKLACAPDASAVDIHAPVGGRVTAFTTAMVACGDDFVACPAMELTNLLAAPGLRSLKPIYDWRMADSADLRQRLASGGLMTHRPPLQPLGRWIEQARAKNCRILIANIMESQPYVTADHRLLAEHGHDVIRGLAMLAQAMEIENIMLAVDRRRVDDYAEIIGPSRMYNIARVALPHKYPIGSDPLLVKVLTRRETPMGSPSLDVGVAVIDAASCFAAYRWVACGQPATGRVVTVSGERAPQPANYFAPYGADCRELLNLADGALIHGGPMTGLSCPANAVVTPVTTAALALEARTLAPPAACIRCGWCTDFCPARLNVAVLNDAFELGELNQARRMGAIACVECGVCTYICPVRLPLSQRTKRLKRALCGSRFDVLVNEIGASATS